MVMKLMIYDKEIALCVTWCKKYQCVHPSIICFYGKGQLIMQPGVTKRTTLDYVGGVWGYVKDNWMILQCMGKADLLYQRKHEIHSVIIISLVNTCFM